jgi:hypothetical protein
MTLKQKFEEILTAFWISNWEDECEKIADEFAIDFANWLINWPEDWHRIEELLELYKKEKGL